MSFDTDEKSTQDNRPEECYEIGLPNQTFRYASADHDVTLGGFTYLSETISRGPITVSGAAQNRELVMYLPESHVISRRFMAQGVPPKTMLVTIRERQQLSGAAIQIWQGFVQSIAVDEGVVSYRIPNIIDDALKVKLPVFKASKTCNHVLGKGICGQGVDMATSDNKYATQITAISTDLKSFTLGTAFGKPDNWARFGRLEHLASNESRGVLAFTAATKLIRVRIPFYGAAVGDFVNVFRGCDHSLGMCKSDFNNVINFGGHPQLPQDNPHTTAGLGVIQQA